MQTYSRSRAVPVVLATVVTGNVLKGRMSPLEELYCLRAKKKSIILFFYDGTLFSQFVPDKRSLLEFFPDIHTARFDLI